ncbi:MAG TPA: hypothetical protein VM662_07040 [Sphingomonas sp.]|nr:hypothetical protein [Sphingomonas sp.]
MTALPADIAAGSRAARIEIQSDSSIKARYPGARDGSDDPAEGFFDASADAVTALTARGALIGTERRRFKVVVAELIWPDPAAGLPTVQLIDPEQGVNAPGLITRIELNLDEEQTIYEVMV